MTFRVTSVQTVKVLSCVVLMLVAVMASGHAEIKAERQIDLLNFLEQDCGSCHGLKRNGGLGSPLHPENLEGRDDDVLIDIILDGIPETAMPPWKEILSKEEAVFLIKHLRKGLK